MLKKLYIDNYKCFVNFEITFDQTNLLLGKNRAGKSSLLEVIQRVKKFILDEGRLAYSFPGTTRTRWDKRLEQTFEIEFIEVEEHYRYRLVIEHDQAREEKNRVREEKVFLDNQLLFAFELGEVQLYRDDGSAGPMYSFDWGRSALALVGENTDNQKLMRFRKRLEGLFVLHPSPSVMSARSLKDDRTLEFDATNFAAWYRHSAGAYLEKIPNLFQDLKEVFEGFHTLKAVDEGGTSKILTLEQETHWAGDNNRANGKSSVSYTFDELSDGQRQLIFLYSLACFGLLPETTLCIDEPDNAVSLREIQPWLATMEERCAASGTQALFISHHPEIINYFAPSQALYLSRSNNGPVRVKPFPRDTDEPLTAAELMARGWEDE